MPVELPYLPSNKNIGLLFEKIRTAKVPESVSTRYLANTFGLKGTADRALITLLKTLGFLDPSGRPTKEYSLLKHEKSAKAAIAAAIKKAYEPLFTANEKANEISNDDVKGLIGQVAGTDEDMTARIMYTFRALVGLGDFSTQPIVAESEAEEGAENQDPNEEESNSSSSRRSLRPDFHYNIQVHLPGNATEETYINIFNAIRKTFK